MSLNVRFCVSYIFQGPITFFFLKKLKTFFEMPLECGYKVANILLNLHLSIERKILMFQNLLPHSHFSSILNSFRKKTTGAVTEVMVEFRMKDGINPLAFLSFTKDESRNMMNQDYKQLDEHIYSGYENWIYPIFENICKKGDMIDFSTGVKTNGKFCKNVYTTLHISIPERFRSNWELYLIRNYKALSNLYHLMNEIEFVADGKKMRQVKIKMTHNSDHENMKELIKSSIEDRVFESEIALLSREAEEYMAMREEFFAYTFNARRENDHFQLNHESNYKFMIKWNK